MKRWVKLVFVTLMEREMFESADATLLGEIHSWILGSRRVLLRIAAVLFLTYLLTLLVLLTSSAIRGRRRRARQRRAQRAAATPLDPLSAGA